MADTDREAIEVEGTIKEALPNATFRVESVSYTHLTLPTILLV